MTKGELAREAKVNICEGLGAPISQMMTWLEDTPAPSLSAHPGFFLSYKGRRSEDLGTRHPCLLWAHHLATHVPRPRSLEIHPSPAN